MERTVTLALETGIYGGSICLFRNGKDVASWTGKSEKTKSEEFLESIKYLLSESQISVREIVEIVISIGPGSYNGLRAGFSLAKGLKTALGIRMRGVNLLNEMLKGLRPITITALPFSKTEVCWKKLGNERANTLKVQKTINYTSKTNFVNAVMYLKPDNLVLPAKLYFELLEFTSFSTIDSNIIFCEENLARLIGRSNEDSVCNEEIKIFYPKPFKIE